MLRCACGRFTRTLDPCPHRRPSVLVDPETGCRLWQGAVNSKGYPTRTIAGRTVYVHRLMYEKWKGPIPPGEQVDHTCRRRRCVALDHLVVTPAAENRRLVEVRAGRACWYCHDLLPQDEQRVCLRCGADAGEVAG